jgi:hypothetical protein
MKHGKGVTKTEIKRGRPKCGKYDTALDVTVINPLQVSLLQRSAREPGHALEHAKQRKMRGNYDECQRIGVEFVPLPAETFGGWHPDAEAQLMCIARSMADSAVLEKGRPSTSFFKSWASFSKEATLLFS